MKKMGSLLSMLILTVGLLLTVVSVTATCGDCQNVCDGDCGCDGTQKHLGKHWVENVYDGDCGCDGTQKHLGRHWVE